MPEKKATPRTLAKNASKSAHQKSTGMKAQSAKKKPLQTAISGK